MGSDSSTADGLRRFDRRVVAPPSPIANAAAARALLTRGGASDVRASCETFFTVDLNAFWRRRGERSWDAARALVCSSVEAWIHFNDRERTSVRVYTPCARLVLELPPTALRPIFPTFVSRPLLRIRFTHSR